MLSVKTISRKDSDVNRKILTGHTLERRNNLLCKLNVLKIWSDPDSDIGETISRSLSVVTVRFLKGFVYSTRGPRRGNL